MQRVSAFLPSWDRPKSTSSAPANTTNTSNTTAKRPLALDKVFGWAEKIAVPVNRLSTTVPPATLTRFGRETYWPAPLDKECDKAARILKSFCTDGFLAEDTDSRSSSPTDPTEPPSTPASVAKKIPPRIIQNAVGLAIFSCMRSGLWMSGSGGAGLITARKADGTWSPPSGIILHTAALGFEIGVDIYDCVLIINSVQTLEMFTRPKLILGSDVNLSVGPLVKMGTLDHDLRSTKGLDDTVLTYVKARGKHQAVPLDGSLVSERCNENMRFYCGNVGVLDILAGNIPKNIPEMRPLFEVIKAAEGRSDYDTAIMNMLAEQPAPGDAVIETPKGSPTSATSQPKTPFGIPDADDPDPFGVIGLEMAGIEIREAGTHLRPASTQFEFNPSPTSPVFGRFSRQSIDTFLSNRGSYMSAKTQATAVTDACTQTDVASTAETSFSRANSEDGRENTPEKLPTVMEPDEIDYTKIDTSMIERFTPSPVEELEETTVLASATPEKREEADQLAVTDVNDDASSAYPADERDEDADDEEDEEEEDEPVICEVATAAQPIRTSLRTSQVAQVIQAKGHVVTIPKRIPPPLPARSPARTSRASKSDIGDVSSLKSPLRNSFLSADSRTDSQPASDGTADTSPAEAFSTPLETSEKASLEPETAAEIRRHHKNTSSVYTAVQMTAEEQQHSGSAESSPQIPSTPQGVVELTSSAEESEREPRTPKTEAGFLTVETEKSGELARENGEVSIVSPHNPESGNAITVA
ncbi:hypothetical protein B0H66DRAFT_264611 [Apodospora peruviana]|uniref:Ysc84 actin-binding domain-containing protein n=1 Tax=Apodospora peruviana TaxID=516989 RepID=A0AAE0I637_9PEZI|nr:hypothetical protein B0H66DRAFT_264611 [Apodospora peruviana]